MKLDKEVRNYFKKWQKKEQVYLDFDIDEVEFEKKLISSVFDIVRRGASPRPIKDFIVSNDYSGEKFNWLKIGDVTKSNIYLKNTEEYINSDGMKKSVLGKKGDFLITNSMTIGVPIILDIDTCFHDGFLYLGFLDENAVNYSNLYLFYFFLSYRSHLKAISKTGVVSNLNTDIVKNEHILLPIGDKDFSRGIQDKLVAFIEYYKAQFDKYRKLISQLKSQIESLDKAFLPAIFSAEKDSFIVEYFDQWSIGKQLSIKFNDINFERCVLKELCSFPPLSRVKGKADLSIQEYASLSSQEQSKYFPLISGTMLNNQITGYLHKDRLSANSLSPSPVLSWTRINASQFFIQNNPVVTNDDSFILAPNDPENIKFIYYSILAEMSKSQFSWTNKAGKEKVKNISIYSLNNSDFSSAIVEFIDEWHNWRDEIFRRIDQLSTSIDQAEEALIAKTFKGSEE